MRHHGNWRYFQSISCGLEQQTTFLPVMRRSTEHFFLIYSALQDDCSPDTLRLLGKTTETCSPCKPEPRPSILQVNVIIIRLQSKVFTCLFSALKALIFLAAELQRLHGRFSHSEHCIDMVRICSSETCIFWHGSGPKATSCWKHLKVPSTMRGHFTQCSTLTMFKH